MPFARGKHKIDDNPQKNGLQVRIVSIYISFHFFSFIIIDSTMVLCSERPAHLTLVATLYNSPANNSRTSDTGRPQFANVQ